MPRAPPVTIAVLPSSETSPGVIIGAPSRVGRPRWTLSTRAPYFPGMTRLDDSPVPDYANRLRLDGRRFVLIGAGQGIGRQTAHALAANGARLLTVDVDPGLAEDIAGEVGGTAWSGDATKREDVERMFNEAASVLGGVDGFVDIVGISRF